jgi:hypothetical protein
MKFNSLAPDYAEVRWWFVWLDLFTPTDLADDMGIHPDLAERFIAAGLWHGIIESTGDSINGRGPREQIYRYKPLPSGPRFHPHQLPEWKTTPGCYSLARATGMPVHVVSDRDRRQKLSTPGARHQIKLRDARREEMEKAKAAATEAQRLKNANTIPKWQRKKKGSVVV